jgi:hypothetical protein
MRNFQLFTAAASVGLLLAGCDPSQPRDQVEPEQPDAATGITAAQEPETDVFAGLDEGWNGIAPGGETICSDGSAYRFFVRRGDPRKLVVYFQGGGACWFGRNCDPHLDPSYKQTVTENEMENYRGIFEFDNPGNPFADYSFVVAPYCTGDVHLGNNVATYEGPQAEDHDAHEVTIHHKGIVNALAVLDWTFERFDPADIFVTGSSAGAIPSPYYAWKVADRYPDARIAQLGDGAGGYRRSADLTMERMEQWGTMGHLERYPEFADMPSSELAYEDLYIAAAKRYPDVTFAEYDAAEDQVQKRFLAMGGNDTDTLRDLLLANHADVRAEVDNFRTYIAGGDSHTILARPEFYTFHVNGRRVRDWVADLAAYRDVENVACEPCDVAELLEEPPAEGGH